MLYFYINAQVIYIWIWNETIFFTLLGAAAAWDCAFARSFAPKLLFERKKGLNKGAL